eukprot:366197_1
MPSRECFILGFIISMILLHIGNFWIWLCVRDNSVECDQYDFEHQCSAYNKNCHWDGSKCVSILYDCWGTDLVQDTRTILGWGFGIPLFGGYVTFIWFCIKLMYEK